MSKFHKQSGDMKALEQSLNDHMEICSFRRQVKRLKAMVARLRAEVASLRASSFVTAVPVEHYERVVKAGDAVAWSYAEYICGERCGCGKDDCVKDIMDDPYNDDFVAWNAAKEGKPSV